MSYHDEITELAQKLAREAFESFERDERPDGTRFTKLSDDAPAWVQPIVYQAHGEMLPDDWKYDCIQSAFGAIADCSEGADPGDVSYEFADSYVDVYTAARFEWLASNLNRQGYVDEATQEFGASDDIVGSVGMGQYVEAMEVFNLVWDGLGDVIDCAELDEEDEEEEDE